VQLVKDLLIMVNVYKIVQLISSVIQLVSVLLVILNAMDVLDHVVIVLTVLLDSINVVLFVLKLAHPTSSLMSVLDCVSLAILSVKLAAVFNSVLPAPTHKLYLSTVSVMTAHILAILAAQARLSAPHVSQDSILSVLPVSLHAQLVPSQATESVSVIQVLSSPINAFLHAQLVSVTSADNVNNAVLTVQVAQDHLLLVHLV